MIEIPCDRPGIGRVVQMLLKGRIAHHRLKNEMDRGVEGGRGLLLQGLPLEDSQRRRGGGGRGSSRSEEGDDDSSREQLHSGKLCHARRLHGGLRLQRVGDAGADGLVSPLLCAAAINNEPVVPLLERGGTRPPPKAVEIAKGQRSSWTVRSMHMR